MYRMSSCRGSWPAARSDTAPHILRASLSRTLFLFWQARQPLVGIARKQIDFVRPVRDFTLHAGDQGVLDCVRRTIFHRRQIHMRMPQPDAAVRLNKTTSTSHTRRASEPHCRSEPRAVAAEWGHLERRNIARRDRVARDLRRDIRHTRRRLLHVAVRLGKECHVVPAGSQSARGNRECARCTRPVPRTMQEENSHLYRR